MTRTASSKSKATAPKPSQIRRYPEVNGTTTETALIEANGSVIVVSTCSPVNVIVSRDRLRCRETVTNRGQAGLANRTEVTMPSTTVPVSSTSAMSPVARVANQSGLVAVATAALGITAAGSGAAAGGGAAARGGRDPEDDEIPDEEDVPAGGARGRRSGG